MITRPSVEGTARQVLLEVMRQGPVSRAELARRLGLSTPSLTRLTKPLVARGLVVEQDPLPGVTGRPSYPLAVDPVAASFLGVKLVGDGVYAVLTDLSGAVVDRAHEELDSTDVDEVVEAVGRVSDALRTAGPEPIRAAVAVGGPVADGRIARFNRAFDWVDVEVGSRLERRLAVPTTVVNDGHSFVQSEHWFGVGRGVDFFLVVTIGFGVGCYVVAHDEVIEGQDGAAGWVEHLPLLPDGPPCPLGHRGCPATLLTTAAMTALTRDQGDPTEPLRTSAYALGLLVATAANLVAPERILVSGEGAGFVPLVRDAFDAGLAERRRPGVVDDITITPLEFFAWARGAAVVAMRRWVLDGAP